MQVDYSGGWRRFFCDTGGGSDSVVFLHGIPTNHRLWRETIGWLPSNIRAIAPDLTGFGRSDLPRQADLSPRQQARDVFELLDRQGLEHFTLVAHDYGFLVACEMLALCRRRVRGVVVTNTSIRVADWTGSSLNPFRLIALPLIGEVAFALARRWMLRVAFRPFVSERSALNDELMDAMWLPFEHGFSETLLRLFRNRAIDADSELRWRESLAAFEGPVSIVWGARDPAFRPDRVDDLLAIVPDAVVVKLSGSNHFVPIDRPRVLARLVSLQIERMQGG